MRSHIVWLGYNVKSFLLYKFCLYLVCSGYPSCLCWVFAVGSRGYSRELSGEVVWFPCLGSYVRIGYGGCHTGIQPVYFQCRWSVWGREILLLIGGWRCVIWMLKYYLYSHGLWCARWCLVVFLVYVPDALVFFSVGPGSCLLLVHSLSQRTRLFCKRYGVWTCCFITTKLYICSVCKGPAFVYLVCLEVSY
jgi:hypothetical protein